MFFTPRSLSPILSAAFILLSAACFQVANGQAQEIADSENDPVKLFDRGQDAHAKGDYKTAIQFYEAAVKLKPEFPEAEFQRAMALLATNRKKEAIEGFNRAVALRPDWAFAYSRFGATLLSHFNDDQDAEPILRRAIELDGKNTEPLIALADLRARAGDMNEALSLSRAATSLETTWHTWRKRSLIEIAAGDKLAALKSVDRALSLNPNDFGTQHDRAKLRLDLGDNEGALNDLKVLEKNNYASNFFGTFELAQLYVRAGKPTESLRLLDSLNEDDRRRPEVVALRAEISGDSGPSIEERTALEKLLKNDPKNTSLLARLGNAYRRVDPSKSEGYYYRALQIEPDNPKHATGYAAALVQLRRFAEAVGILQRVINKTPDDYVAHANLALALYELKRFAEALPEYEWLAAKRPEISATYFFIATAHDNLGEYEQALAAYEKFLSQADPANNKLEIEKVNLRLPVLRDQIKRGQGMKRKHP